MGKDRSRHFVILLVFKNGKNTVIPRSDQSSISSQISRQEAPLIVEVILRGV